MALPYSLYISGLIFSHKGFQRYNAEFLLPLSLDMTHDLAMACNVFLRKGDNTKTLPPGLTTLFSDFLSLSIFIFD